MRFIYTKVFLWFSIGLVALVVLLFMQTRGWLDSIEYAVLQAPRPVAAVVKAVVLPIKHFGTTITSLRGLVKENAAQQDELIQLRQRVVDADQLRAENELLRKEIGLAQKSGLVSKPCSVLSRDPEQLADTIIIDCGESQGIKEGEAVLSQGYLVGKVFHVGSYSSTVFLITNAQSSIDAQIVAPTATRTTGVVKGSFGSGVIMDFIPQNSPLNTHDIITTAGISSSIPKNILIGEVSQILSKSEDLFKKASIVTPINFRDLDFVFVVES